MKPCHRHNLVPLKPIDLMSCSGISDILHAMEHSAFGARMLGNVAKTYEQWIRENNPPVLVYNGKPKTRLHELLIEMEQKNWIKTLITPDWLSQLEYLPRQENVVVVGHFSEDREDLFYGLHNRTVYLNDIGQAKPGQVRDGYYPDVVFSDPRFVMPMINWCLQERIERRRVNLGEVIVNHLAKFGGLAKEVVDAAHTMYSMILDPDCEVILTLSGALTIAKMTRIFSDMIDLGWVQYLFATGALMGHGLIEDLGCDHYIYQPNVTDEVLAQHKLNRVTDTLEPEENFDFLDNVLRQVFAGIQTSVPISPSDLHREIGRYVLEKFPNSHSIFRSAFLKNVPIYVPAWVDSETANDWIVELLLRQSQGGVQTVIDPVQDSLRFIKRVAHKRRTKPNQKFGIVSFGGGPPRNNSQNNGPLTEIILDRLSPEILERVGLEDLKPFILQYGCKVCPDKHWWGSLGGCTYEEGTSWRKFAFVALLAEVHSDATIVIPFLSKFLMGCDDISEMK